MGERRDRDSAPAGGPVPRDLPDQQADTGDDPWEVPVGDTDGTGSEDEADPRAEDVPDTDEAGTGRRGTPRQAGSNPDQPVPDEPSA